MVGLMRLLASCFSGGRVDLDSYFIIYIKVWLYNSYTLHSILLVILLGFVLVFAKIRHIVLVYKENYEYNIKYMLHYIKQIVLYMNREIKDEDVES